MHGEWAGGKGSTYRKLKNLNQFYENWDKIFPPKEEQKRDDKENK